MDIKNIHEHAGWFASYMTGSDRCDDAQGQALVRCQAKKIEQLTNLVEIIKNELELCEDPKEESAELILQSIKSLIEQEQEQVVEDASGYFKWIG